jgi:hypothetical protein
MEIKDDQMNGIYLSTNMSEQIHRHTHRYTHIHTQPLVGLSPEKCIYIPK